MSPARLADFAVDAYLSVQEHYPLGYKDDFVAAVPSYSHAECAG